MSRRAQAAALVAVVLFGVAFAAYGAELVRIALGR
jgi:hypothetical protein